VARTVDFGNLDDDDLRYMAQRPWMVNDAERQGYVGVAKRVADLMSGSSTRRTGPTPGVVPDMSSLAKAEEPSEPGDGTDVDYGEFDDEDDPSYDDWTLAELKQEAAERDIPFPNAKPTKTELAQLLRENDESSE